MKESDQKLYDLVQNQLSYDNVKKISYSETTKNQNDYKIYSDKIYKLETYYVKFQNKNISRYIFLTLQKQTNINDDNEVDHAMEISVVKPLNLILLKPSKSALINLSEEKYNKLRDTCSDILDKKSTSTKKEIAKDILKLWR